MLDCIAARSSIIALLVFANLTGCSSSLRNADRAYIPVIVASSPPKQFNKNLGILVATDGSGCGFLGAMGNHEDALYKLKLKAQQAGADYVHVYKTTKPYSDRHCRHNAFTLEGTMYITNSVTDKAANASLENGLPNGQIVIHNPGFEDDLLPFDNKKGWHFKLAAWDGKKCGVVNVAHYTAMYPLYGAAQGNNMAFLNNAGSFMQQTLQHELKSDHYYQLNVIVGHRAEQAFGDGMYETAVYAGNKLMATKKGRIPLPGRYEDVSLRFRTTAQEDADGQALRVVLKNINARQINFDDVALFHWPVAQGEMLPQQFVRKSAQRGDRSASNTTQKKKEIASPNDEYLAGLPDDADLSVPQRQFMLRSMNMYQTKSGQTKPVRNTQKKETQWNGSKTTAPEPGSFSAPGSDKPILIDVKEH